MKIEIEIPSGIAGFIRSLSLSEIDNDKIFDDVTVFEHYDECVNFGLLYSVTDPESEEETIHYLTRLGKEVYDYKFETYAETLQKKFANWEEDFEHENGKYVNQCIKCRMNFIGHKRRVICRVCASAKTEA